jgi:hypothetical protein
MNWQPVKGWEELYEVSSDGLARRVNGSPLKQWAHSQGYMLVRLSSPRAVGRVHRLVAQAFIPNPLSKPSVNHINNCRDDNRVENLEWCTQQENLAHAANQGRMVQDYWKVKRSPKAQLSEQTAKTIRDDYAEGSGSWKTLARKYGISKRTAGRIINGESYV